MSVPDAPWIGMCRDDWVNRNRKVFATCEYCGEEIYVGEDYYDLRGEIVCESCVIDCSKTAEED